MKKIGVNFTLWSHQIFHDFEKHDFFSSRNIIGIFVITWTFTELKSISTSTEIEWS